MADKVIGLICAIPQEERVDLKSAPWNSMRKPSTLGGLEFDRGRLDGHAVVLAEAGIGKVNTAVVATLLASRFDAGSAGVQRRRRRSRSQLSASVTW